MEKQEKSNNKINTPQKQGDKQNLAKVQKTSKASKSNINMKTNLIAVIRISGMVKVNIDIEETLHRMKLRRKYSCILISNQKDLIGMLKKVRHYVAYGELDKENLVKLIKARGRSIDNKKFEAQKIASELIAGKSLKQLGFKGFFRLHPPRKGINSKLQYPKGVLGDNKQDINKLIERML